MDTRSPEDVAELNQQQEIDEILRWFQYGHLIGMPQEVSQLCAQLALTMTGGLQYSEQLKLGLYDLLRAKDCFVRAAIAQSEKERKEKPNA